MQIEAELKLGIAPADHARVALHHTVQVYAPGGARREELTSTYFDTPELALLDRGIGLRVRRVGPRWVQTIKSAGAVRGGLHRRREWNVEVESAAVDLARIDDAELRSFLSGAEIAARLTPIFTTEFERTVWDLKPSETTHIEMALDHGTIRSAAQQRVPISEIELELKSGELGALYDIALALARDLPLTIENDSKAARGYAFFRPRAITAKSAPSLDVQPTDTVEGAFRRTMEAIASHLQANETAVLTDGGPEALRQMHLAATHLSRLLALFGAAISARAGALHKEVAWLGEGLSAVLECDRMRRQDIEILAQHCPRIPGLENLSSQCNEQRRQRRGDLYALLRTPRYTRLVLEIGRWLVQSAWRSGLAPQDLAQLAAPTLPFATSCLEGSRWNGPLPERVDQTSLDPIHAHSLALRMFGGLYETNPAREGYLRHWSRLSEALEGLARQSATERLMAALGSEEQAAACLVTLAHALRTPLLRAAADQALLDLQASVRFWQA